MKVLFIQLPIPQLNFGKRTGNIPLGAGCIKQAADHVFDHDISIVSENISSYLGDAALIQYICSQEPDIIGFTIYVWNIERSKYLASEIKKRLNVKIIFGGPEITPDNPLIHGEMVDCVVFGEGELAFIQLMQDQQLWAKGHHSAPAGSIFQTAKNPYVSGILSPEVEDMMAIETQRGCPYRCGYCNYNKALSKVTVVPDHLIVDSFRWATDHGISEVFLLDPSLNTRPNLQVLMKKFAEVNSERKTALLSEIRAESVSSEDAVLFAKAGVSEFEIGLQTIHPEALKLMNRPTDLKKFCLGIKNLQQVGIKTKIDLMIGLPGDTLEGFKSTVDFVADQQMHEDIQIFFLSVLPGTEFRKNSTKLGLRYDLRPPYQIFETPTFSQEEMREAFYYAEDVFDVALQPAPDLDLSYRMDDIVRFIPVKKQLIGTTQETYYSKIVIDEVIEDHIVENIAKKLSHPYQIFFMPTCGNPSFIVNIIRMLTHANPHTPLEIIFFEPKPLVNIDKIEDAICLHRPLYLDLDMPAFGSRSVLYSVISSHHNHFFGGIMKRQVYWWKKDRLPELSDMESLNYLDGILIDGTYSKSSVHSWQTEFASIADTIFPITFGDIRFQDRWMALTASNDYYL